MLEKPVKYLELLGLWMRLNVACTVPPKKYPTFEGVVVDATKQLLTESSERLTTSPSHSDVVIHSATQTYNDNTDVDLFQYFHESRMARVKMC